MKWRVALGKCWLCGEGVNGSYCGADCIGPRGWRAVRYLLICLFKVDIS